MPGGCIYEPKRDGFRLAILRDVDVALWSRPGKNLTKYFPELAAAATELPEGCVVDGEAVIWNAGRLDFEALQQRLSAGQARPAASPTPVRAVPTFCPQLPITDRDTR